MRKFLWLLTMISSVLGGLTSLIGVNDATSAPQQAAAAAVGVACAIIPYCMARAWDEMKSKPQLPIQEKQSSQYTNIV